MSALQPSNQGGPPRSAAGAETDDDTIFVSIAAYRDPDLAATIEDLLAKARRPDRMRFGICWQHGPDEKAPSRFADPRFRVLDVDWRESRGACWARSRIMKLWQGEQWYLQLDSHHRFTPDWDARLLAQAAATGSPKPVISTYPGSFYPDNPSDLSDAPSRMDFGGFTRDGLVILHPTEIDDWRTRSEPRRSRFVAAGFLFAPGRFVIDVPYDPHLYFFGEEITLAVRAFTHGYDLYHPGEAILWHEYTRTHQPHHWADHVAAHGVEIDWSRRDARSRRRAQRLLTKPKAGRWGVGVERSLADYETYAGISFARRRIQDHTRRHLEPPNPPAGADWLTAEPTEHTVEITFPTSRLPAAAWRESDCWYVGAHDWEDGEELFRRDADAEEVASLLAGAPEHITLIRTFSSEVPPTIWMVHAYSAAEGWLDPPIRGKLTEAAPGHWKGTPTAVPTPVAPDQVSHAAAARRRDAGVFDRRPRATAGLRFSETEGGFSITLPGSPTPLLVNGTGLLVLELANGRYSVSEIIAVVQETFGLDHPPQAEVLAFLDSASLCGLISSDIVAGVDPGLPPEPHPIEKAAEPR